jgi:hypothetical protein
MIDGLAVNHRYYRASNRWFRRVIAETSGFLCLETQ